MKGRRQIPTEIKEVLRLVQSGKLFALQAWITAGKPVRPSIGGKSDSLVLRAAVESGFHSMVEELLRADGWSPADLSHALELAREIHQPEIASLLGDHGAQPKPSDFRTSCEKLDLFMMERLLRSGVDANQKNVFAEILSATKARPLLRFLRQFQAEFPALQDQAALALAEAVKNRQARWVALLVWAGADPFRQVPHDSSESFPVGPVNCTCAARESVWRNSPEVTKALKLKPTPAQAVELLWDAVCYDNYKLFRELLSIIPPAQINDTPRRSCSALESLVYRWPYRTVYNGTSQQESDAETLRCMESLLEMGARWNPEPEKLRWTRRHFLKHEPRYVVQVLRLLIYTPNAANLDSVLEVCRSQTLLAKIAAVDAPLIQELKLLRKDRAAANTSTPSSSNSDTSSSNVAAPAA